MRILRRGIVAHRARPALLRSPASERELLDRVLRGEPEAEDLFFGMFRPRLLRDAAYFLGGWDGDAEDVVQDTFMVAIPKLGEYVFGAPIYSWLRQICLRLCYVRLRGRKHTLVGLEEDMDFVLRRVAADRLQIEELEVRKLADLVLMKLLILRLDPDSRRVIELRSLQGMRYDRIGRSLGIPIGTVMSRLSRARSRMRVLLRAVPEADGGPGQPPGAPPRRLASFVGRGE